MRKPKRKQKSEPVYGLVSSPVWLIRSIIVPLFLLTVVIFSKMILKNITIPEACICLLCPVPFILYFMFILWSNLVDIFDKHLIIKKDGIQMQLIGIECFAHWDNLDQFAWQLWNKAYHWGILVNKPIEKSRSYFSRIFYHADAIDSFIPLDYFEDIPHISDKHIDLERFKKTPLGSDLYYYAPHLFDEVENFDSCAASENIPCISHRPIDIEHFKPTPFGNYYPPYLFNEVHEDEDNPNPDAT